MIALPLPLIVAFVIAFLLVRDRLRGGPWQVFHSLLLFCLLQSGGIALLHHYGVSLLARILPVTACLIPPLAWLAFREALFEQVLAGRLLVHLAAPALAALCLVAAPWMLDLVVPAVFLAYGSAILLALRRTSDLPLARLEAGPLPARIWQALAFALLFSALGDAVIAAAFAMGRPDWHGVIVSVTASLSLLLVALLSLERTGVARPEPQDDPDPAPAGTADDAALVARLEALLRDQPLYLEADLTLARLARRLGVPAKSLSAAINRATGDNVSRLVNGFRIRHACTLLDDGLSVTETIYAAGFNTKSNFNREFQRVTGTTPSAWATRSPRDGMTGL